MQSNHRMVFKTLQDTLSSATALAINKATLTAFKMSNDKVRQEEGIPSIPIYRNVKFTKATLNRPTSRLWIYDNAQVDARLYNPIQTATGITFMRPVKLGGKTITTVAHGFIPRRLEHNNNPKNRPFKRVGRSRLPIIKLQTSTLYDYYSYIMVQSRLTEYYNEIFSNIATREIARKLTGV